MHVALPPPAPPFLSVDFGNPPLSILSQSFVLMNRMLDLTWCQQDSHNSSGKPRSEYIDLLASVPFLLWGEETRRILIDHSLLSSLPAAERSSRPSRRILSASSFCGSCSDAGHLVRSRLSPPALHRSYSEPGRQRSRTLNVDISLVPFLAFVKERNYAVEQTRHS